MRSLDYCLLKKKEFKAKINYYTRKGAETNTTYMINAKMQGEIVKVDAVEYFRQRLREVEEDI
jgi:hypothetical protein